MSDRKMDDKLCPKCEATDTPKRETIGKATVIGYNKAERHPYREPEKVPVKGIVCQICGHVTFVA